MKKILIKSLSIISVFVLSFGLIAQINNNDKNLNYKHNNLQFSLHSTIDTWENINIVHKVYTHPSGTHEVNDIAYDSLGTHKIDWEKIISISKIIYKRVV